MLLRAAMLCTWGGGDNFRHRGGREMRLTEVPGRVVRDLCLS